MTQRFRNPPGSPERLCGTGSFLKFLARQALFPPTAEAPRGHALPREEAKRQLAALAAWNSLTWLGHATFLMRLGGRTVLTDPFLTDYASPLAGVGPRRYVPPGLAIGDLPLIDLIVVSHNHYEHLDLRTIAALPERERTTVVVPLGLGRYFATRGFRDVRELGWYGATRVGPLAVKALPAIHFSKRGLFDRNRTLWASFAIEAEDGSRLYFGGDTAYGPVFAEIGEREGPFDLAMLGIGAYEPRAVMSASHATPEEAVRIARDLGARRIVGMHWGTIVLTPEPPFEAPARFRAAAEALGYAADEVWLLRIGESRSLPPPTARAANRPT